MISTRSSLPSSSSLDPSLRGKPVAVAPVLADGGCRVAASYEAKRFGVKTGTRVRDARRLCPDIIVVKTQHRVSVEMHHKIIAAVESCPPVEHVISIDEMSCRLSRAAQNPKVAIELAHRIKATIRHRVGECTRSLIGIAPNRFLAKVGTDMQKPDGLVVIQTRQLPHRLHHLAPQDLSGIGPPMAANLGNEGITTVA